MNDVLAELLPGALVLLGAGAVGAVVAVRLRGATVQSESGADDLDERLAHLLAHLRDLDEQRERLTPESYTSERARIEAQATALMRQREAQKRAPAAPKVAPAAAAVSVTPGGGFFTRHPELKGALWGGGVVLVLAFLYVTLLAEQTPRGPGGSLTGNTGAAPPGRAQATDPEITALLTRLREVPNDVDALVRLAHLVLRSQMLDEARVLTDRALQIAPDHPEARVHDAVLVASTDRDAGLRKLDALVQKDPTLAEAWLFRGMLGMQSGDQELMRQSFAKFVEHAPEGPQRERIRAMLQASAQASP